MSALLRRVEGGGDLGTANIAIVVLDEDNQPVAGVMYPSNVVKDGVVVDYLTASRVVARLKQILEQKQGCTLERAAIAVPPGISEGNTKVIVNVVELAGFIVTQVLDEPVAAASALNIKNGAVVDVGGGTTGMSILKSGKVTFSADEPTGGSHMKLVIAGALGLPYAEAEEMKKNGQEAQVVKMSKICNDLRLLSSGPRAGLNEINLPELQAGSSIMPAKVNPVVPEVVNQVCFKVIGNDTTVTMAAEAGQLQLNVMEPVIGQAMFESVHILTNACYNLLEKCINGITANKEVCEGYVYNSIGIVTYLNPFIGHHNGDIVGKICAETGKSVREVVLERGLLTEAELDDIFSVQNLMHPAYKAKRYTDESEQ